MAKSKFVASEEIEDLSYDFSKYIPGAAGTIPEPSTAKMNAYRKAMSSLVDEVSALIEGINGKSRQEQMAILAEFLKDESTTGDKIIQATAAVCSDMPSADDIRALPYRVQQAFFGWITGVFLRPEASVPVLSQSQAGTATA